MIRNRIALACLGLTIGTACGGGGGATPTQPDAIVEDAAAPDAAEPDAGGADAAADAEPDVALPADGPVDAAPPTDGPPPDASAGAYSQAEVQGLFQDRCAGCHTGGASLGDLSLEGDFTATTVGIPSAEVPAWHRIEPGDHARSYLWRKLAGTHQEADVGGSGTQMPQARAPFTPAELERLALYIDALPPLPVEICGNGLDDDANGQTDCDDAACGPTLACQPEDCANGLDDNGDALADCADPLCAAFPACVPEDCGNGVDDDGDALTDCNDDSCLDVEACRVPYTDDELQQVFNTYCVGCHVGGASLGGLALDAPFASRTVLFPSTRGELYRIEPGSRERSFLFHKISGTQADVGGGDRMPQNRPPLNALQIERVGLYIDALPRGMELCDNGRDDDGDRLIDCNDADCLAAPACAPRELCDNGVDDDGDFLADCNDLDCAGAAGCGGAEDCADNRDNDGDLLIDCQDANCLGSAACLVAENCGNGADDDADGAADCADADCLAAVSCRHGEVCGNGGDEDGDGLVDCQDGDCALHPTCQAEICGNGLDDNANGATDCADAACAGSPACQPEICDNGFDDDADLRVDCQDPDCAADLRCQPEDCLDGIDNNGDGRADCADPQCQGTAFCNAEVCDDGVDNDQNGFTDCFDRACADIPPCITPFTTVEVQTLLVQGCGCHSGNNPSAGMRLDMNFEAATVNVPSNGGAGLDRVEPGAHLQSYLWLKVAGQQAQGQGSRMPLGGPYLSDGDLARLGLWIDQLPH